MYKDASSFIESEMICEAMLAYEYLDIAEVLIMALDTKGIVTMINKKGAQILGYEKEEIVGKEFDTHFALGVELFQQEPFTKESESLILSKEGDERLILWKCTQLKDDDANVAGLLCSGEDITQSKIQQQQILQKSRLEQMGEMMSMVAHQWKQPLGAISAVSTSMMLKLQLNEFALPSNENIDKCTSTFFNELQKINTYVQSLATTIDDFKHFYKIDREKESASLEEVLESALNIFLAPLNVNEVVLEKSYSEKVEVLVHYNEMIQVLVAILQNAYEHCREQNVVKPRIVLSIEGAMLSISDNGGGIPQEILFKIFDPYFSTKENKNGTGLGLYMSKMIVEEHHRGKLYMENTQEGACFYIDLSKSLVV